VVRREAGGEPVVTDIAACREYTLNLDLQRLPILEELGKDDRDNFDMFGPLGWAAIYYARAGIPVFPLAPGSKIPHKGSAGVKDATTDTRRIRPWRRRHPNDNIGLACGVIFDALDIDCKDRKPGYESLTRLRLAGLTQGAWATAHTPTGGRHVLFAPSGDGNHSNGASGLDFRGVGGYIVASPSRVEKGVYQWEFAAPDARGRPFDWTAAMECLYGLPPKPEHRANVPPGDLGGLVGTVANAEVGERNNALYWAACRANEQDLPTDELLAAAVARGLSQTDAVRTITSASRAPQRRPT
jgi:hypothetical protein